MNEAHFEILGLTVPSRNHKYYDDGFVSSISEATMQINNLYGQSNRGYDITRDEYVEGRCCKKGMNHHIFYLKHHFEVADIRIRAHEETHALEQIGGLDYLMDQLYEDKGVEIDFYDVDNIEVRADLGAMYALDLNCLSSWRLVLESIFDSNFIKARKLYNRSKVR